MPSRLLILTVSLVADLYAAGKWVRVEAPGIEVLSNAGPAAAREAVQQFARIRHVFESRTRRLNIASPPVRVFVFRSTEDFRPFKISDAASGYYHSGGERDYIAMHASGSETRRITYHEYAHLLMRHSGYRVPLWLNEGTAEMFSTIAFDKSSMRIGDVIEAHVATVREKTMLDLRALLATDNNSPHYNERAKSGIFYAQSWALVHMLNFSPDYERRLSRFVGLVLTGEHQADAFQRAFGKTLDKVSVDLAAYIRGRPFAGVRLPVAMPESTASISSTSLADEEAELALADLFLALGRQEQSEAIYAKLAVRQPDSPAVQEALGDLALHRNQDEVARRHYERAIELGSGSGRLRYDYAALLREKGEHDDKVIALLKEAVALDSRLFDAYHLLGHIALRRERYTESIAAFERAAELQPGRASLWEYLAQAYQGSGKRQRAVEAAKTARKFASGPEEVARIEATLKLIEESL